MLWHHNSLSSPINHSIQQESLRCYIFSFHSLPIMNTQTLDAFPHCYLFCYLSLFIEQCLILTATKELRLFIPYYVLKAVIVLYVAVLIIIKCSWKKNHSIQRKLSPNVSLCLQPIHYTVIVTVLSSYELYRVEELVSFLILKFETRIDMVNLLYNVFT